MSKLNFKKTRTVKIQNKLYIIQRSIDYIKIYKTIKFNIYIIFFYYKYILLLFINEFGTIFDYFFYDIDYFQYSVRFENLRFSVQFFFYRTPRVHYKHYKWVLYVYYWSCLFHYTIV